MIADVPTGFYFDTYALIERGSGKPSYRPYSDVAVLTHQANVYEFIAAIMRRSTPERARTELRLLEPNLLEASTEDLFAASRFYNERRRDRISYVDALGYTIARREALRFLTGDRAFAGLDGVEFVP